MKKLFLILLLLPAYAFAADCEVDGISDSPQKFSCSVHHGQRIEKLSLSCVEGRYQIHWLGAAHDVTVAYHEEVEEGSNPLVFVTDHLTLTKIDDRIHVSTEGRGFKGRCSEN